MNYVGFYAPVVNLDHINAAMHTEVAGILGNNLLNKSAYQIDWDRNTLLLMHTPRPERPADAIPVTIREHRIYLQALVNGRATEFALDTGAYTSTLAAPGTDATPHSPTTSGAKVRAPKIDIHTAQKDIVQTQVHSSTPSAPAPSRGQNMTLMTWDHNALGMDPASALDFDG